MELASDHAIIEAMLSTAATPPLEIIPMLVKLPSGRFTASLAGSRMIGQGKTMGRALKDLTDALKVEHFRLHRSEN